MKRIAVIALEGGYTSSFSELLDVTHIANLHIAERLGDKEHTDKSGVNPAARITWQILSIDGQTPRGAVGLPVKVDAAIDATAGPYDIVFVPALDYPDSDLFLERLQRFRALYPWLREQWRQGAVIASICTGTFVLAEAGLLDGRRATTSWWLEALFRRRYPAVDLDVGRDITEDDRVFCGGTLSLNLKLALTLLERFLSSDIFNLTAKSVSSVARRAVLPPGVVLPGDEEMAPLDVDDDLVARAQYWFQKHLARKIKLADVAESMLVSEKTLVRHFKKTLGITPHEYLLGIRIDTAKSMLVNSNLRVEQVAERVGYGDISFFQQVFRKRAGVTPTAYRKAHAAAAESGHELE